MKKFQEDDMMREKSAYAKFLGPLFWDFEDRENAIYNFEIINLLLKLAAQTNRPKFLCKPLFLIIVSLIEIALFTFLQRCIEAEDEKIPNLSKEEKQKIEDKELPRKLVNYNDLCYKHGIYGNHSEWYQKINKFADLRNKVHIQKFTAEREIRIWSLDLVKKSAELLADLICHLGEHYPRPKKICSWKPNYDDFPRPWKQL